MGIADLHTVHWANGLVWVLWKIQDHTVWHTGHKPKRLTIDGAQYGYLLAFKTLVLLYDPQKVPSPQKQQTI